MRQTLTVEVECDTPLEPVAEYHKGKAGQHVLDSDGYVAEIYIIVTPKKEPEVSEPKYTIPVEVSKEVYEKYSGARLLVPRKSNRVDYLGVLGEVLSSDGSDYATTRMVLTPRFEYPPELRSPRIWGIAIDQDRCGGVYTTEPVINYDYWYPGTSITFAELRLLFPDIKLPTLADAGGDWEKAIWQNPDFDPNWKGE